MREWVDTSAAALALAQEAADSPADERPLILVVGGGPIGLEAAASCRYAGFHVTLAEQGDQIASSVRAWSHVRLFTQNSLNNSPDGLRALEDLGWALPAPKACPTGAEFADNYLEPLARWLAEDADVLLSTRVDSISRGSLLKGEGIKGAGDHSRDRTPFRALLVSADGEETVLEDLAAVIDCSGTFGNGNFIGRGGAPAVGERRLRAEPLPSRDRLGKARDHFFDGIPDVLHADVASFLPRAGSRHRTVAIVGGGYSAATTIHNLLDLAASRSHTFAIEVEWLLRKPFAAGPPYLELEDDLLPSRHKLVTMANHVATSHEGAGGGFGPTPPVRVHRGVSISQVHRDAEGRLVLKGVRERPPSSPSAQAAVATGAPAASPAAAPAEGTKPAETAEVATDLKPDLDLEPFEIRVDTLVSQVGYRPSYDLASELQVHLCYASEGPMKLASSLLAARVAAQASGDASAAGDCLKQAPPGPELLTTPEPHFYVLGSKSYGRASSFLLSIGHKQVEAVVGMLKDELLGAPTADGAAADNGAAKAPREAVATHPETSSAEPEGEAPAS